MSPTVSVSGCKIIRMVSKDNLNGNERTNGFQQFRHWNSDVEYIYVKKGYLVMELDENIIRLEEGWFIIITSNTVHTFLEAHHKSILYIARIPLDDFYQLENLQLQNIIQLYSKCLMITCVTKEFIDIFESLIFADYGIYNQLYILGKAMELTTLLLTQDIKVDREIAVKTVEDSDITVKIQRFIEESLSQPLTLSMLANHLGFSETYCSKLIKQKINMGFLEYVNQMRLQSSEEYLRKTNMSIAEICHAVGFNSVASFNRNFKRYRGLSPTEHRKGMRSKLKPIYN